MKKLAISIATLVAISSATSAQEMKACDDETFAMVMDQVEAAADDKKEMAMEELNMAKEKMAANMSKECSAHLEKASMVATGG